MTFPGPVPDETVEAVAEALFDFSESFDKLVIAGMVEPRQWNDLPEGCQVHDLYRGQAEVAIAAFRACEKPGLTAESLAEAMYQEKPNARLVSWEVLAASSRSTLIAQAERVLCTLAQEPDRG